MSEVARLTRLTLFTTFAFVGSAVAQTAVDTKAALHVAELHSCAECHNATIKVLGPSFKEIATKYKDDKTAMEVLSAKVRKGGVGVWGQIAMPPSATIKDDELKLVLSWILSH